MGQRDLNKSTYTSTGVRSPHRPFVVDGFVDVFHSARKSVAPVLQVLLPMNHVEVVGISRLLLLLWHGLSCAVRCPPLSSPTVDEISYPFGSIDWDWDWRMLMVNVVQFPLRPRGRIAGKIRVRNFS